MAERVPPINIEQNRLINWGIERYARHNAEATVYGVENVEAIKELLTALLLFKGLRSKNHQCIITYFYKNYPHYEGDAYLIAEMNYLRNRLNYYGEQISPLFYEKNKERIEKIVLIIRELIEKM